MHKSFILFCYYVIVYYVIFAFVGTRQYHFCCGHDHFSKLFYYALKLIKVINMPPTYAYGELWMNALVNIHLEQCRDYAWTQNRIKDVIREIRMYYLLNTNCSARCAIIKKFEYTKKKQLEFTCIWTRLNLFFSWYYDIWHFYLKAYA